MVLGPTWAGREQGGMALVWAGRYGGGGRLQPVPGLRVDAGDGPLPWHPSAVLALWDPVGLHVYGGLCFG